MPTLVGATVQSVERAFSILETFDEQHPARTAADIAEAAGLARPTTYRMLQTLRRLGYVRNVNGRFEVTPRVLRLGAGYLGRESLAARAQPTLDAISEQLGEHIAIGVLDGDEVITLAAANSPQSRYLAVAVQVGQRLPAERTSLGRILLAHRPAPTTRRPARSAPTATSSPTVCSRPACARSPCRSATTPARSSPRCRSPSTPSACRSAPRARVPAAARTAADLIGSLI